MSEQLTLLCDRPHAKDVDFDGSRFVVSVGIGLNVAGKHLEMGDEIPRGALNSAALRQEYEATHRIETAAFAAEIPSLREACARRGVDLAEAISKELAEGMSPGPTVRVFLPALNRMTRKDVVDMCQAHGLPTTGKTDALYERLETFLDR